MTPKEQAYGKTVIGPSSEHRDPQPKPGFSIWIENGIYYTAPSIDEKRFGGHAYDNGGYEHGVRNCPCGCYMGSESSAGPVDPFGPCPMNPLNWYKPETPNYSI